MKLDGDGMVLHDASEPGQRRGFIAIDKADTEALLLKGTVLATYVPIVIVQPTRAEIKRLKSRRQVNDQRQGCKLYSP